MAKTLEQLKEVLVNLVAKVIALRASIDADVEQTRVLVTEVRELIAFIRTQPNAADFEEQVAAVEAAITGLDEADAKLKSDDADVATAVSESNTQVPPTPQP